MKRLIPLCVILFLLASCTTLRKFGGVVCGAQETVSEKIAEVGAFFGPPGSIAATVVNVVLRGACSAFEATLSAPADLATDTGLLEAPADATTTPVPVPDGR